MPVPKRQGLGKLSPAWRWALERNTWPPDNLLTEQDDWVDLYRELHPRQIKARRRAQDNGRHADSQEA